MVTSISLTKLTALPQSSCRGFRMVFGPRLAPFSTGESNERVMWRITFVIIAWDATTNLGEQSGACCRCGVGYLPGLSRFCVCSVSFPLSSAYIGRRFFLEEFLIAILPPSKVNRSHPVTSTLVPSDLVPVNLHSEKPLFPRMKCLILPNERQGTLQIHFQRPS